MIYEILHQLQYRFSKPVFFEPHRFFLRPRHEGAQTPIKFSLQISPSPAGQTETLDAYGNTFVFSWFNDLHQTLSVQARSVVETLRKNPTDFFLETPYQNFPLTFSKEEERALSIYLGPSQQEDDLRPFYQTLTSYQSKETLPFLNELNQKIYNEFEKITRLEGDAWPAPKTLKERKGSCRDLSTLFIDCCRSQGIPARFVSGYFEGDHEMEEKDLHGWAEVYLGTAGWRGYDPLNGLLASEGHVALAATPQAKGVLPLLGTYRGDATKEPMTYSVRMKRIDRP